jgi:DNA processing protein
MLGVQSLGPVTPRCVTEVRVGESPGRYAEPARGSAESDANVEREAWVILLGVPGLGPVTFAALLAAFGSARAVLHAASEPAGPSRLCEALPPARPGGWDRSDDGAASVVARRDAFPNTAATTDAGLEASSPFVTGAREGAVRQVKLGVEMARRICETASTGAHAVDLVRSLGLAVVTLDDPTYPERLRRVDMPPPLLFVRGAVEALNGLRSVAVVGTRWPSDKGRLIAGWIGSGLARAGAVVVSGLAVGVDGAAHAAVVGEGRPTVAVLGGGHARLFPKAHERLADAIVAAGGAVVAELSPDTPATRGTFPRRNRLVSGLADATVVVEAGSRSGALITAGWALEQGRDCFLVPGPIDAPTSAGCNAFLRSFPGQARVVCGIPELIEDLDLVQGSGMDEPVDSSVDGCSPGPGRAVSTPSAMADSAGRAAVLSSLGPVERLLAESLSRGPATADDLAAQTALSGAAILSALTLLELRGLVRGSYGRYIPAGVLARAPDSRR